MSQATNKQRKWLFSQKWPLYLKDPMLKPFKLLDKFERWRRVAKILKTSKEPEPGGKVSGYKWYDRNQNREWDEGDEEPLADWTIELYSDLLDHPIETQITNEEGYYEFEINQLSVYYICEVLKEDCNKLIQQ